MPPTPAEGQPLPDPRTDPAGVLAFFDSRYVEGLTGEQPYHRAMVLKALGSVTRQLVAMQVPTKAREGVEDIMATAENTGVNMLLKALGGSVSPAVIADITSQGNNLATMFMDSLSKKKEQ